MKKLIVCSLTIWALTACVQQQHAATWADMGQVKIGSSPSTIFIHVPVKCHNESVPASQSSMRICRYLSKEVYSTVQQNSHGSYIQVSEYVSSNCTDGTSLASDVTYYGTDGKVVFVDQTPAVWRPVIKGGMDEKMEEFACNR